MNFIKLFISGIITIMIPFFLFGIIVGGIAILSPSVTYADICAHGLTEFFTWVFSFLYLMLSAYIFIGVHESLWDEML